MSVYVTGDKMAEQSRVPMTLLEGVIMCTNSLTHLLSDDSLSDKCWKTVLKQRCNKLRVLTQ